jgi:membrane protein implicated in regulation of membrane protease activity
VRGESWRALCREGVDAGDEIVVLAVSGLTLEVRPK